MSKTWYEKKPSTEDDRYPDRLTLKPKTVKDLFAFAEESFGFTQEEVRTVMQMYGFRQFFSDSWGTYTSVLLLYHQDRLAAAEYPKDCPECHAPIERDKRWDNRIHCEGKQVRWGWKCPTNSGHFLLVHLRWWRDRHAKQT